VGHFGARILFVDVKMPGILLGPFGSSIGSAPSEPRYWGRMKQLKTNKLRNSYKFNLFGTFPIEARPEGPSLIEDPKGPRILAFSIPTKSILASK
jgi:hypothetical protein